MAMDTVAKRWSMLNFGARLGLPVIGDGVIGRGDRSQFFNMYAGILAEADPSDVTEYRLYTSTNSVPPSVTFSDTTIATGLTVIGPTHYLLGTIVERLTFSLRLSGGSVVAVSGFQAEVQIEQGGLWIPIQKTWGDAADESGFVLHTPDNLEALAHNVVGMAVVNPLGLHSIRFKAGLASLPAVAITRRLEISSVLRAGRR